LSKAAPWAIVSYFTDIDNQAPARANYSMKKVLHVGCGSATIEKMPKGFQDGSWEEVRYDISPDCQPDYIGDMLDMSTVSDGSMDALYSSHNVEHVFFHEVPILLKEFRRVLRDDGFCVITCPDIQEVARFMAQGKLDEPLYQSPTGPISPLDIMYGHSASIEHGRVYMAHKTGFSLELLAKRLNQSGFGQYHGRRRRSHRDLWFIAAKNKVSAGVMEDIFIQYTPFLD